MSNVYHMPQLGLVTTLDILGIRNLMQTLSDVKLAKVASDITTAFNIAKTDAENVMQKQVPAFAKDLMSNFCNKVMTYNFSDTIIFSLTIDDDVRKNISNYLFYYFYDVVSAFYKMFESGLPVRGCIDYGSFCKGGNLILGRPFINSFAVSESLDFSGLVITKDAFDFYDINCEIKALQTVIMDVPVKSKNGTTFLRDAICANWLRIYARNTAYTPLFENEKNLRSKMIEIFSSHGKNIDDSVLRKIVNTENIIRSFVLQNERLIEEQKSNNRKESRT